MDVSNTLAVASRAPADMIEEAAVLRVAFMACVRGEAESESPAAPTSPTATIPTSV